MQFFIATCRMVLVNVGLLSVAGLAGCQQPSGPDVAEVKGKVVADDGPVAGVELVFKPTQGRNSIGVTSSSGDFVLDYTSDRKGAVVGKHMVSFMVPADDSDALVEEGMSKTEKAEARRRVPPRKIEHTETVEVKKGTNSFEFDLSGKL